MTNIFQSTTSLALIGLLLICPYLCLGEAQVAEDVSSPAGCTCHDPCEQSNDKSPESPKDSDHDCLCQGAITDALRIDQQQCDADELIVPFVVLHNQLLPSLADPHLEPTPACQFATVTSGRDLCALISARLL